MHEVCAGVVQPRTLAAGGMSWALMKHPEGLAVHFFVSHCWSESFFEFAWLFILFAGGVGIW